MGYNVATCDMMYTIWYSVVLQNLVHYGIMFLDDACCNVLCCVMRSCGTMSALAYVAFSYDAV